MCNLAGEVCRIGDIDQEVALGPDDLMPDVVKRLDVLLEDHRDVPVYGIGLSLPGTVDRERGCSRDSPILRGWDGVELRPYFAELQRLSGVPVMLDNDANAIALARARRELSDSTICWCSRSRPGWVRGSSPAGYCSAAPPRPPGSSGTTRSLRPKGFRAGAVTPAAWRPSQAAGRVVHALQQQGRPVRHMRDVVELANGGDAEARRMIRDSGRYVGEVVAAAVNLLNPAVLVVSGDLAGAYEIFVAGLRETLYGNATAQATRALSVVPASNGGPVGDSRQRRHGARRGARSARRRRAHRLSRPARTISSDSRSVLSNSSR